MVPARARSVTTRTISTGTGYNRASVDLVDRFALHDKTGVEMGVVPH
jgi:hypothetical protein